MPAIALLAAVLAALTAAAALRRRRAHPAGLGPRTGALPAGRRLLASAVSDLSDVSQHLHAAAGGRAKPRLAALLVHR